MYFVCKTNLKRDTKEVWGLINSSKKLSGTVSTVKVDQQQLDHCTEAGGLRLSLISLP